MQSIYQLDFIFLTMSRQHSLTITETARRRVLEDFYTIKERDSPVLEKNMLTPAQHQKPAATKWGTTRDQFQYIHNVLPKFHVLQSFACSPI